MEGAGIFTILGLLVLAPFMIWAERVERFKRQLTPHEQDLQRASHGLGIPVVIAAAAVLFFGPSAPGDFVAAVIADPASMAWPAVLLMALLAYCLVRFIVGVRRAAGVRDELLASRAFVKFALGAGGVFYLWPGNTDLTRVVDLPPSVRLALLLLAIWCADTGAVRFLLLTVGGGNALRIIMRNLKRKNAPLRPARRRPWWKFW
jgi:hypothetical protein